MPQYWTAHRSSLTRSLWPSEAYIVGTGSPNDAPHDAQTMPSLLEPHLPSIPGPRRREKRDKFDPGKKPPNKKLHPKRKQRTTRRKPGTRDAPPLAAWAPCSGNYRMYFDIVYVKDGAHLHFTTRMRPLSPNPVKRWGPHPERCPGLSDK